MGEAIGSQHYDMVKLFLDHGADTDCTNRDGEVPLTQAIRSPEIVSLLLDYGAHINVGDPLNHAVLDNAIDSVSILLERGANPNNKDSTGNTPLHYVRSEETVQLLIDYGADKNITNNEGFTPARYKRHGRWLNQVLADFIDQYEPIALVKRALYPNFISK